MKSPLECTKRSTITICLVNIDLDTIEDLNKLLSNQLGHACSKITIIIHRKVHFYHAKNLPTNCLAMALGQEKHLFWTFYKSRRKNSVLKQQTELGTYSSSSREGCRYTPYTPLPTGLALHVRNGVLKISTYFKQKH